MRKRRKFYRGVVNHVYQKSINGVNMFYEWEDYIVFYTIFSVCAKSADVEVLELCIMYNHFHGLIRAESVHDLSSFMDRVTAWFVMEHNTAVIDDAIRREVERGGQVYYLHNRTETIDQCASALKKRIPGLSAAVAHGQMGEEALGDVMQAMNDGTIQVLVCTTIIETGLDIPNANTLIIENADRFGLSQLHQLRGRVGRSTRHAYAYFTYKPDKSLSEVAEKRLAAIRDFAEFGSGFKIAMRDLEIRGAGNLLGAEQSGHMEAVGYDLYCKMLNEAVLDVKGAPDGEVWAGIRPEGFVLDEKYPLAFIAVVENGGYGSSTCVPILSRVLAACKTEMDGIG